MRRISSICIPTYNTTKTRDMAMGDKRDASSGGEAQVLDAKLKAICMSCMKRGGRGLVRQRECVD